MDKRPPLDWEAIEREDRAAQLSRSEIARRFGITEGAIRKRANDPKRGWKRDLSEKVRAAVRAETVRAAVRTDRGREPIDEHEAVAHAADRGARAVEGHLARAQRLTRLVDRTLSEIEAWYGADPVQMEAARVYLFPTKGDSLTGHLRASGDLIERVTRLERTALNLDVEQGVDHGAEVTTLAERLMQAQREMEAATVVHSEPADGTMGAAEVPPDPAGVPGEPA
jgi:hypothetical protein